MLTSKIEGQTVVFKNDKGFYSTSIGNKQPDGSYKNAYIALQFKKGVNLENKTQINIKNGFLTFDKYTPKNGNAEVTSWKIVVMDFDVISGGTNNSKAQNQTTPQSDFELVDDGNLPF